MISSYEELLQYVRKLENALDVKEEGGITTTEVGGHLEVDGDIKQNGEAVALYRHNIHMESNGDNEEYFACIIYDSRETLTLNDLLGASGKFMGVLCSNQVEHTVEGMLLINDNSLIEFYRVFDNESVSIEDTWEPENIDFDDTVTRIF